MRAFRDTAESAALNCKSLKKKKTNKNQSVKNAW